MTDESPLKINQAALLAQVEEPLRSRLVEHLADLMADLHGRFVGHLADLITNPSNPNLPKVTARREGDSCVVEIEAFAGSPVGEAIARMQRHEGKYTLLEFYDGEGNQQCDIYTPDGSVFMEDIAYGVGERLLARLNHTDSKD